MEKAMRTENTDRFVNFYRCPRCKQGWEDVWSCMCDDDCPHYGCRHIAPYKSQDIESPDQAHDPERAFRGEVAQRRYRELPGSGDEPQADLNDLLTDLRHFAAREGLDFGKALELSRMHYEAEAGLWSKRRAFAC